MVSRGRTSAEPSDREVASILAGRAWLHGRLEPVEIAIDTEGRIHSVGKIRGGAPRHDVGEGVIVPAATDLHVHFREPGGPAEVENIATGTVQAALGGVTLVGDMPNHPLPINSVERLEEKSRLVPGRAAVDVLLYASPYGASDLAGLARHAGAFKLYLSPTTGITEVPRPTEVPGLLQRLADLDLPVSVHAEDPGSFVAGEPPRSPADWDRARPNVAEAEAIGWLLGGPPRLRLHVAHVTTSASAEKIRSAGHSFEASPHHLLLSDSLGPNARLKVNPPLRSEAERRALWEEFRRGRVPIVGSDHAPHSADAKDRPFDRAPSGMPGVETLLPLLLARVRAGDLDLPTLLAAACDRPARWLGQPFGRIAPGHRANLLVIDFRSVRKLSGRTLHAPCGWTAFEGWDAILPREHYRDGERIVEDGEFVGARRGTVVRPEFAQRARSRSGD
jgi:dihydroorotase